MNENKKHEMICAIIIDSEMNEDLNPNSSSELLTLAGRSSSKVALPLFQFCLEDDQHIKMPGFHEEWVDKYLLYDFYVHFRMTRHTCNKVLNFISPHINIPKYRGGAHRHIPKEKILQITLWYLSKGCNLETVDDRFNMATKTVFYSTSNILEILNGISHLIIKWPSERECEDIERDFRNIAGFPGIIGAMDGCHFLAKVPVVQHDSYQDRHFQHSVSMQGICLKNLRFINISAGYPGSLHDAHILRESHIFKAVEAHGPQRYFFNKYHLVADSAYPCKEWIMKPYRVSPNNTRVHKNYNTKLSKSRVFVEHSFGVLKGRWKI